MYGRNYCFLFNLCWGRLHFLQELTQMDGKNKHVLKEQDNTVYCIRHPIREQLQRSSIGVLTYMLQAWDKVINIYQPITSFGFFMEILDYKYHQLLNLVHLDLLHGYCGCHRVCTLEQISYVCENLTVRTVHAVS
jgi:hypothetical protein